MDTRERLIGAVEPLKTSPVAPDRRWRKVLLLGSYIILFLRYTIATFLSSFFSTVPPGNGFSGTMDGLIFAAYPMGMAITSVFAPIAIMWMGTRVAVYVGLVATTILTIAFGVGPDIIPSWQPTPPDYDASEALEALFFITYFLNGMIGALAETACLILVSAKFQGNSGMVMASVNTVSTMGCMLGPVVGGVLYSVPGDAQWAFRLPFLVCGVVPLLILPFVHCAIPQEYIDGSEGAAVGGGEGEHGGDHMVVDSAGPTAEIDQVASPSGMSTAHVEAPPQQFASPLQKSNKWRSPLTLSVGINLISIALSGTIVGTLDPTLGWRLSGPPFRFSPSMVSLFFFYSSAVYVATSTPVGRLVDKAPASSRLYACSPDPVVYDAFAAHLSNTRPISPSP